MTDCIVVTGGAGFIGSGFVLQWLRHEASRVVVLDKLTYAGSPDNLHAADSSRYELVKADIGDHTVVADVLARYTPFAVVNLAAESHVDRAIRGPADFIETNVTSTFRLLESVRGHWTSLPDQARSRFRFLHVSTDEVFGSLDPGAAAFAETAPYAPSNPYSASKAASDHFVRAWHRTYGLPVLITRCSNNYGPRQFPEKLIPQTILRALEGKSLPVYGDGEQMRDWLHVDDHCRAIRHVLREGRVGETYNISAGNERRNIDVVHMICDVLDELLPRPEGGSYRQQIRFVEDRPGHDRRYAMDAGRLRQLGWQPAESFTAGLRQTVQWYLDNPAWVASMRKAAADERS